MRCSAGPAPGAPDPTGEGTPPSPRADCAPRNATRSAGSWSRSSSSVSPVTVAASAVIGRSVGPELVTEVNVEVGSGYGVRPPERPQLRRPGATVGGRSVGPELVTEV